MAAAESLDAGRTALARGQWQDAREAFERAIAEERSADALEGLGWALYWLDESEASFEVREEAYRLFLKAGDVRRAARAATNLGLDYADFGGLAVTAGWLQRARRLLEDIDECPEHGWLALWEGHLARMDEHNLPRAKELAARALEIGLNQKAPDLEQLARALEGLIMVTEGAVTEGMQRLDEATAAALAGEMSDVDSVAATCCLLVHACERVRDYDRASQWNQRMQRFSKRWSTGSILAPCKVQHAAMLIGLGDWEEAERELETAEAILRTKRPLLMIDARLRLGELRRKQGRWEEAEEIFRSADTRTESLLGRAAIAIDSGHPEEALGTLERFLARPFAEKWIERVWALQLEIDALAALGRVGELESKLQQAREVAHGVGTDPITAIVAEAEGIVATATSDHERARRSFEDAVRFLDRACAPYEAARVRLRLASSLAELQRIPFAVQEARSAAAAFEKLGAARDAEKARALLQKLSPPATAAGNLPLSPREMEVLRLVAEGLSDKEVAGRLRLSEHTVHRHVSNILTKLEVPSRAAAVAHAARMGGLA
jgi:ATP/maltotriose-dependent transcriptional regulator MalT